MKKKSMNRFFICLFAFFGMQANIGYTQEYVRINGSAFGLVESIPTSVTAGTVLGECDAFKLSTAFDDSYKVVDLKSNDFTSFVFDGIDFSTTDGIQGNTNPKNVDGANPATTTPPSVPVRGAVLQINTKKDGYIYVWGKLSSHKNYTVFGEGSAIGYQLVMQSPTFGKLDVTVQGEGEYNYVMGPIPWPEVIFTGDEASAVKENGMGVIKFFAYADCTYLVNACGTKMSIGGAWYDAEGDVNVSIKNDDGTESVLMERAPLKPVSKNLISVNNVAIQDNNTTVLLVDLQNETEFTAFQMDLELPEGFEVATTVNEDGEEALDITLDAARKKTTHSLSYNVLADGTIRLASFSSANDTFKGSSGTLVQIVLKAKDGVTVGDYSALLDNIRFTVDDGTEHVLKEVRFAISYSQYVPVNIVSVSDVELRGVGSKAVLAVDLQNETEFSAFLLDLKLPIGFYIPTTINEDGEEVLDITLHADRKKSTHTLSYNVLDDGTIRIASFSSTNATFEGTSGTIVEIALRATEEARESVIRNRATLKASFTTPEGVDYNLGTIRVPINYSLRGEADAMVLDSAAVLANEIREYVDSINMVYPEYTENALFESVYYCIDILSTLGSYFGETLYNEYRRVAALFEVLETAIPQMSALKVVNDGFKDYIYKMAYPGMEAALAAWKTVNDFVWTYREDPTGITQEILAMSSYLETAQKAYQDSYIPDVNLSLEGGQYGRCILNGNMVFPEENYSMAIAPGSMVTMWFVPFEGYALTNMKRNGELIVVRNNCYEGVVTEDVVFSDLCYKMIVDTVLVPEITVDTLVVTETIVDTLVVTETVVDTLVVTETIVDTVFVTEVEELPIPVIANENGVVTITCEQSDVVILYAINGDPLGGSVYTGPFEVNESAVVSAVAVRAGEAASLSVSVNGIAQSQQHAVSRRYYTESGIEIPSPSEGITVVVVQYEDGSTRTYKMMKK